jgi:hypothetical protein
MARSPKAKPSARTRSVKNGESPNQKKVRVFISYDKADSVVATALFEEISDINRHRIDCFLDSEVIESGEGWKADLDNALVGADWLVCVYTGEESNYCGYEVGVFTHGRTVRNEAGNSRLVCLHDVPKIPGMFLGHQNRSVEYPPEPAPSDPPFDEGKFYSQSGVAKFFEDLCRYDGLYVARDNSEWQRQSQTITRKAKRITDAFKTSRGNDIRADTPTQLGVEISVRGSPDQPLTAIPASAQVKGTYQSLGLFGKMPAMKNEQLPTTTWGEIKEACRTEYDPHILWVERLERDMLNAAAGDTLAAPEAIFLSYQAKRTPYRAILVRHQLKWDGTHTFSIVFVGTLPRHFLGDQKTSLILAGLVVASRFRFTYLEQPARIAAQFADNVSDPEFEGNYRQFLQDLERMKIESMELGLADSTAFMQAFGESRQGKAESFLTVWKEARAALDEALPPSSVPINGSNRSQIKEAIEKFLNQMAVENARFLRVAVDAYREELEVQLRVPAQSADERAELAVVPH